MKPRAFVLATVALSLPGAALAFEPCATPIPAPIAHGVQLFSPANGAAGLPTNAAIVFSPLGGAVLDPRVTASAGGSTRGGTIEAWGDLRILHLTSALTPGTAWRLEFVDTATMPPQSVSTSSFLTGTGADVTPPKLTGAPIVAIGPFCSILHSYPIDVTWPAATDDDETVLSYSVALASVSSLQGVGATTGLAASFAATPGSEFDVTVRAFDRAGAGSAPISAPVFVPGPSDNMSSGGCRCAVTGTPARPLGILSSWILGLLSVICFRRATRDTR